MSWLVVTPVFQDANIRYQLAGDDSGCCAELESRTTPIATSLHEVTSLTEWVANASSPMIITGTSPIA